MKSYKFEVIIDSEADTKYWNQLSVEQLTEELYTFLEQEFDENEVTVAIRNVGFGVSDE